MVSERELINIIESNNVSKLNELLMKGMNPNGYMHNGLTPLHVAVYSGNLEMVEILLQHGANPNVFTIPTTKLPKRFTPLQIAVMEQKPTKYDIAKTLIKYGANVNLYESNSDLSTGPPLFIAIARIDYATIKLLLDHGADINANFISKGCYYKPLGYAALTGDIKITELLIQYGARVEESNDSLYTPYHAAAFAGNLDLLKFLFNIYPAPNIVGCSRSTPIFSAVASNSENFEVVKYLVEVGADVNFLDIVGNSVLFYALKNKKDRVASYLAERGARIIFRGKEMTNKNI
ncbi:ankyrin repeat domain-containing protein [Acidianus sp. HS-5]|uniref:ankyrin repeat domain-containing protein n=1 Tax=Acidianus sp. HS-5 TaxID=2886040 RepID=UPI001F43AB57|nr:ankyrin repeat domain-containing protein [Acidianus sp. HS-5]BDC18744.1 hypothetical protein HS5_16340 [Acidianus sp. HS-5]